MRSYNSLRKQGVHTIGALASRTEKELLAIDGLGPQSVKEIRQRLADRGLSLSSGVPGEDAARTPPGPRAPAPPGPVPRGGRGPATAGPGRSAAADQDRSAANGALPRLDSRPPDEDALDLLSVAGLPVLKRVLPVFGVRPVRGPPVRPAPQAPPPRPRLTASPRPAAAASRFISLFESHQPRTAATRAPG